MNADPEVMAHFPTTLSRAQSDELIEKIEAGFEANGFGLWALELHEGGELIGFAGLAVPGFEAHFTPAVEVGWRLARSAWGKGYASEAGAAALAFGFEEVGLDEIVSFTTVANGRSRAVMERLGMTHDPEDDFEHPDLPEDEPLRAHVLYRIAASRSRHRPPYGGVDVGCAEPGLPSGQGKRDMAAATRSLSTFERPVLVVWDGEGR